MTLGEPSRTHDTLVLRGKSACGLEKRTIRFPCVADCDHFLNEFACEIVKYDDEQRTIRYTHPENAQDDALHATNYAVMLGVLGRRSHP